MDGSETATMFESSMIMNDTPEAQSSTRARRPLTHRAGRGRASGADVRASCVMARPFAQSGRAAGHRRCRAARRANFRYAPARRLREIRPAPPAKAPAPRDISVGPQGSGRSAVRVDPPPRLKREIAIPNERPQIVADRRTVGNERARQFGQRRRAAEAGELGQELSIGSI